MTNLTRAAAIVDEATRELARSNDEAELIAALRGFCENQTEDPRGRLMRIQHARNLLARHAQEKP